VAAFVIWLLVRPVSSSGIKADICSRTLMSAEGSKTTDIQRSSINILSGFRAHLWMPPERARSANYHPANCTLEVQMAVFDRV